MKSVALEKQKKLAVSVTCYQSNDLF